MGSLQLPYAISLNHPSINRSFHASTSILRIRILTSFRLPTPTISRIDGDVSLDNDEFMQCAGWITRTYCIVLYIRYRLMSKLCKQVLVVVAIWQSGDSLLEHPRSRLVRYHRSDRVFGRNQEKRGSGKEKNIEVCE